jgi:hypothetical protein
LLRTAQGEPLEEAQAALSPIPVQTHTLFNPTLNHVFSLLAAILPSVLQIVMVTASGYSVGIDVETRHRLRILRRLGGGLWPAMAGKVLPNTPILLGFLWCSVCRMPCCSAFLSCLCTAGASYSTLPDCFLSCRASSLAFRLRRFSSRREIFRVGQFSTFATISALSGLGQISECPLCAARKSGPGLQSPAVRHLRLGSPSLGLPPPRQSLDLDHDVPSFRAPSPA